LSFSGSLLNYSLSFSIGVFSFGFYTTTTTGSGTGSAFYSATIVDGTKGSEDTDGLNSGTSLFSFYVIC
jgi:hypothetical protein